MKAYADLGDLPEDERIRMIVETAAAGNVVGFIVENKKKAERYIKKLGDRVRVYDTLAGPRTKTVTRRIGWAFLTPGTLIQPVVRGQGLKKGERVEKIGGPIRVVSVTREPLNHIYHSYSPKELAREGFAWMTPFEFVTMFCQHNPTCTGGTEVTRIEFEYVE